MEVGPGAKAVLFLAALVVILTGMRMAAPVLLPLMFATFLAIVTSPLMAALNRRGLPGWLSVTVAVLVDLAALVGVASLVATSITGFDARLPVYQTRLVGLIRGVTQWLEDRGLQAVAQDSDLLDPSVLLGMVGALLRSAAGILTNLALVFVVLVFILVEAAGLRNKLTMLVGGSPEQLSRFAAGAMQVQKYLMVKTMASLVTGVLAGLITWVLGVDLPLVWGLLAFVLNYVPAVGSIIAALPPVLVAILMKGPGTAAAVAAAYLAINMAIGNFIEPRILGRTLGLSPLIVLLSVVFWGFILGPAGALLSVPLTVAIKILMSNSEDLRWVAVVLGPSRTDDPLPPPTLKPPG
jgi:AI-2 transport protein TqsA